MKLCMSSLIRGLYPYTSDNIFMASKKSVDFILKVRHAVREHDPKITFKMCFGNYSYKLLDMFAK